jgi:lysophospholipase L1-like esterase
MKSVPVTGMTGSGSDLALAFNSPIRSSSGPARAGEIVATSTDTRYASRKYEGCGVRSTNGWFLPALLIYFLVLTTQGCKPKLPKVVLLGDSIRLGYTPSVKNQLAGGAIVVSPEPQGDDSDELLKNLEAWVIRHQPDVVHFNCGLHDIKKSKTTGQFQVPPERYEANLRKIVGRIRNETKAIVLFATTTPILDDRAAKARSTADSDLLDENTKQYNRIARKVMKELNVPVNDLRAVVAEPATRAKLMADDGFHYTPEGYVKLGAAVAQFILKYMTVLHDPAELAWLSLWVLQYKATIKEADRGTDNRATTKMKN